VSVATPAPTYGALLDAVRGVRWPARRPVASAVTGVHPSRVRGTTAEFTEFRAYRQGDDPRRLDWRLLARSDRAYIRLATERATLPTTVIVDASASMAFPAPALDKWRLARELTVGLAAVAHAQGDPVALAIAARGGALRLPPRSRRGIVGEIVRQLEGVTPEGSPEVAPLVLAARTPRLAIVTDLLGDADALLRAAALHLAAGGEVHLVHVIAAEEIHPARGAYLVRDPESSGAERALSDETRSEYERRFAEWRGRIARAWRAAGASYTEAVTDVAPARLVRRVCDPLAGAGAAAAAGSVREPGGVTSESRPVEASRSASASRASTPGRGPR
jgi:uncharacterized protein (DUF58 family)